MQQSGYQKSGTLLWTKFQSLLHNETRLFKIIVYSRIG
jgi:hypothetical protein